MHFCIVTENWNYDTVLLGSALKMEKKNSPKRLHLPTSLCSTRTSKTVLSAVETSNLTTGY
jgi:hypothetical protein